MQCGAHQVCNGKCGSDGEASDCTLHFAQSLATRVSSKHVRDVLGSLISGTYDIFSNPTILGVLHQDTKGLRERRKAGVHYTSESVINKVIEALFLQDFIATFERHHHNRKVLEQLLGRMQTLHFFDPACGCGDFLVVTFRRLRLFQYRILHQLLKLGYTDKMQDYPLVSLRQFFGIDEDSAACELARCGLQMMQYRLDAILQREKDGELRDNGKCDSDIQNQAFQCFDNDFGNAQGQQDAVQQQIVCANALRVNWQDVCPLLKQAGIVYLIGNPPFLGKRYQSIQQKQDLRQVMGSAFCAQGNLDYVCGWFVCALEYMNQHCRAAFVTTESIVQGEQASGFWKPLQQKYHVRIDFAIESFQWTSASANKAVVRCVVVGFSKERWHDKQASKAFLVDSHGHRTVVSHINEYLLEGPWIFLSRRTRCPHGVTPLNYGSFALDGGHFTISKWEYDSIVAKDHAARQWLKPFVGAEEFLNGIERYCVWLVDASEQQVRQSPVISYKVRQVQAWRNSRRRKRTQQASSAPMLFAEIRQPTTNYLALPVLSSSRRPYLPIAFVSASVIASNQLLIVADANLYVFGVLNSQVHNDWFRKVAGRLGDTYRYSVSIVYNNFLWPNSTNEDKRAIKKTANAILRVRSDYSGKTLAWLYDPDTMPDRLRQAHADNDRAVMNAYQHGSG